MSTDLVSAESLTNLPATNVDDLASYKAESKWLPRLQLFGSNALVKQGKIGPGRWGIPQSDEVEDLGKEILITVNVDDILDNIYNGSDFSESETLSFEEWVYYLADHYKKDIKINSLIDGNCKACEFRYSEEDEQAGFKSGFKDMSAKRCFYLLSRCHKTF